LKVCYCDESGTGDEPIAVMAGIVVDSTRMHITKENWGGLLSALSGVVGRPITELHTKDFYPGNGVWRGLDGPQRSRVTDIILGWFARRRHRAVYSAVDKKKYFKSLELGEIPEELNTPWRFMGFHLILSMQRCFQKQKKPKGNTIFIFDNEEREERKFIDLLRSPPVWSDSYYSKRKKQERLDQVVDVPYFSDSKDVALIQMADFVAFFLRRYAEIKEKLVPEKYTGEAKKISSWVKKIAERSIGSNHIYPKTGRCKCADLFYSHAPASIRRL